MPWKNVTTTQVTIQMAAARVVLEKLNARLTPITAAISTHREVSRKTLPEIG